MTGIKQQNKFFNNFLLGKYQSFNLPSAKVEALKRCKSLRDNPVLFAQQRLSQNIQLEEYVKN